VRINGRASVRSASIAVASDESCRSVALEVAGSCGGTSSDGGSTEDVSVLDRKTHNPRRQTATELAMELGQQPHDESGRSPTSKQTIVSEQGILGTIFIVERCC
jgi:hypothetical protein